LTIAMPDSIIPPNMPPGYPAYLAYVDGDRSEDAGQVRAMFPGATILTLTVLGGDALADGCDREPGDLSPGSAAQWALRRIKAGQKRPVVYASVDNMGAELAALAALGVDRGAVRVLTAHYGQGEHICGPATCRQLPAAADGTQWTDSFAGLNASKIDMSSLEDDFFGGNQVPDIALNPVGTYTDGDGHLYLVGTDSDGYLCEVKRTAPGQWGTPYRIAGKTGA
jgi:hypothetical protein